MKVEAEKCLAQSEKFKNKKTEFESSIYAKIEKYGILVMGSGARRRFLLS